MSFIKAIIDSGIRPNHRPSEKRTIWLTNSISLVLNLAILVLLILRWIFFEVAFEFQFLIFAIFFFLPVLLNRVGFHAAASVLICWAPTLVVYFVFIKGLTVQTNISVALYDAMKIFLLGMSALPFIVLSKEDPSTFLVGLSVPAAGLLCNDWLLQYLQLDAQTKGLDYRAVSYNQLRAAISFIILAGSCLALRSIVDVNEQLSEERYRELFVSNPIPMLVIDIRSQHILEANEAAQRHYQCELTQLKKFTLADLTLDTDTPFLAQLTESVHKMNYSNRVWRQRTAHSKEIEVELTGHKISYRGVEAFMLMVNDITERQKVERSLNQLVTEKELLMKEMHHRIKNNLQLISSLLYLEEDGVVNPETKESMQAIRLRIKSLSLVHDRLMHAADYSHIDLVNYLKALVNDIETSLKSESLSLTCKSSVSELHVQHSVAVYCGLIVNELITNAMKYAFAQENGTITVELNQVDEAYTLSVTNSGALLPDDFDLSGETSVGLKMLKIFADQLKGKLLVERLPQTQFLVKFNPS